MTASANLLAPAVAILRDGIEARVFPGAAVAVNWQGELLTAEVGSFRYDAGAPAVTRDTLYDLASLTKPIATASMAMVLIERQRLSLDSRLSGILPEFGEGGSRASVTIRHLLAHTSGLPAYVRLFETCRTREELVAEASRVPLEAEPGSRAEYSDVGFLLLGEALARIAGEPLNTFCAREVFRPLGMEWTQFTPAAELRKSIPPTERDDDYRKREVRGEVHDENAWVMNGVAGHAGLFAPASDVAKFAACVLRGGAPLVSAETLELFTTRQTSPAGTTRTLGWDTPSAPSSSGNFFGPRSCGHLGFTGTSLWFDPDAQIAVTLLTNRTWPRREATTEAIKAVRPRFHDAVMRELLRG